ncbi:DUF6538 domain-containing protein [Motiliproteus sp. SC1-56]|uniref:DUF6538 domain-containing protein n=1 Tax=Motiliproteus sp. SC1-56 TaxID=2799565 RepID=UPI001A8D5E4B|nr:DUF6538 domain-containing protein [Motiliproteus sp. SC1-56]
MPTADPYLVRSKHQIYHFRIIVPAPFRALVGLREIRRHLQTKDLRTAQAFDACRRPCVERFLPANLSQ